MRTNRLFVAATLVAITSLLGCQAATPTAAPIVASTQGPTAPLPPTQAAEKTHVTLWLDANGADTMQKLVIDPFNAQSPDTVIDVTRQPNRWDAMRTALTAGSGPDIIGTPGPSFAIQLARAGYFLPLDTIVSQAGLDKTLLPWALELGKVNGTLFSIPDSVGTLVLFYNKTLFDAHGWTPPKTMDDLATLAGQMKAAGVVPFAHANAEYRMADEWYITEYLNHVAGPQAVYDALTGNARWDVPGMVQAMEDLNQAQQDGWFMGSLDKYYTTTFAERDSAFASGKAAMNIEGTWAIGGLMAEFGAAANNTNDWDWAPVPSKSGDAIYDIGIGGTWSINAKTEHPDAAAQFLAYYYQPEVTVRLVAAGYDPAAITVKASDLTGVDARYAAIIAAMGDASAKGDYGYASWTFWPPKSEQYLINVEKVWSGDETSAQFLSGLQDQFDAEKAAGELPPITAR